jgi:hypothetical protein
MTQEAVVTITQPSDSPATTADNITWLASRLLDTEV